MVVTPQLHIAENRREWLYSLQLTPWTERILDANLKQLDSLEESIHILTVQIAREAVERPDVKLLTGFTSIDY